MLMVVASYRQNVHAYPSGGGDYEVATVNLGPKFGLVVASALMVDYVLTVAVSVSSGVANLGSAWPFARDHPVGVAVTVVARARRDEPARHPRVGRRVRDPDVRVHDRRDRDGRLGLRPHLLLRQQPGRGVSRRAADRATAQAFTGFAFAFLLIRAFSSGCAALTGVEAISNGVPAFKKPKSKNAATTLLLLGMLAVTMFVGIVVLARLTHVQHPASRHAARR